MASFLSFSSSSSLLSRRFFFLYFVSLLVRVILAAGRSCARVFCFLLSIAVCWRSVDSLPLRLLGTRAYAPIRLLKSRIPSFIQPTSFCRINDQSPIAIPHGVACRRIAEGLIEPCADDACSRRIRLLARSTSVRECVVPPVAAR